MKRYAWLAAAGLINAIAAGGAAQASPITSTAPFTEGALTFSNFSCSSSGGGVGLSTPSGCGEVNVNQLSNGIQFHAGWDAGGLSAYSDYLLGYTVTSATGISQIGMSFNATASAFYWLGYAVAEVTETVYHNGVVVGFLDLKCASTDTSCVLQTPPYASNDIPLNGTYDHLDVVKDIYVGAFLGNAGLSYVNQTFQTAVPEPASLALLGTGLLGLSYIGRRKRPVAA
jgi:hypothetical protein